MPLMSCSLSPPHTAKPSGAIAKLLANPSANICGVSYGLARVAPAPGPSHRIAMSMGQGRETVHHTRLVIGEEQAAIARDQHAHGPAPRLVRAVRRPGGQ